MGSNATNGIINSLVYLMQLPEILPYPQILPLDDVIDLSNKLVYIIKEYRESIAVVITINGDDICVRIGDWKGNIDPMTSADAKLFVNNYMTNMIKLLATMKLSKVLLYFAKDDGGLFLVDVRTDLNKFTGPGMIRDVFSGIVRTQEVTKIVQYDDKVRAAIKKGKGAYSGNLIIKSSVFGTFIKDTPKGKVVYPTYGHVVRSSGKKQKPNQYVPTYRYKS